MIFYASIHELKVGDFLEPRPSHVLGTGAVFGSRDKGAASVFLARLGSSVEIVRSQAWDGKAWKGDERYFAIEQYPDSFKVMDDVKGWIYTLKEDDFKSDERLKGKVYDHWRAERAEIVKVEEVKDMRKWLEKNGMTLVSHEEKIKGCTMVAAK